MEELKVFDSLQTKTTLFTVPLRKICILISVLSILIEIPITSLDKFSSLFCFIFEKKN